MSTQRGATATYKCGHCGGPFTARTADRKRGWARFCSKSCKARRQEALTGQHAARLRRSDSDDDHDQTMDDATAGWDEGGWLSDDSGCDKF